MRNTAHKVLIITSLLCVLYYYSHTQEALNLTLLDQEPLGILANDVWGYIDNEGREYVIAGTRNATHIYLATDTLSHIATVSGVNSIWRDIKSYQNYLYVVADQGADGVIIIDMSYAPDSISHTQWFPKVDSTFSPSIIQTCHNIWIDTSSGLAFLAGCNVGTGGVAIFDLTADPLSPSYVGIADLEYAHDVITLGDRMYTSEIYGGFLGIYDISDPSKPNFLTKFASSTFFTHNAWPSDDGRYIFTTDEKGGGYVDAYDISDLDNIVRLGTYRPSASSGVLPHNVHYHKGFLVTSWYTEGVIVLDANRPNNLIKVAQYDTNPQDANGNWGAYPYFPSGRLALTDMDNGIYWMQPQYKRACYLEGRVLNATTNDVINKAEVKIISDLAISSTTGATGEYYTGVAVSGDYLVSISHPDYHPDTVSVNLSNGEVRQIDFSLSPRQRFHLNGSVYDLNNQPIDQASIEFIGDQSVMLKSDENGFFETDLLSGKYEIAIGKWGYKEAIIDLNLTDEQDLSIQLELGYQDNFNTDLGWIVGGNASSGRWERAIPLATFLNTNVSNPNSDSPLDQGPYAYVTGNRNSSVSIDDVDNGTTTLLSPPVYIGEMTSPVLDLSYWFFNEGGASQPNDSMTISILSENLDTILLRTIKRDSSQSRWISLDEIEIPDSIDSPTVQLLVAVSDDRESGHIVEAGIDAFQIYDLTSTATIDDHKVSTVQLYPNPSYGTLQIKTSEETKIDELIINSITGTQTILPYQKKLDTTHLPAGIYWISLRSSNKIIATLPFIKLNP